MTRKSLFNSPAKPSKNRFWSVLQKEEGMFGLGTTELIVIGVIVFLIFGAERIPEIGKGLGGALREFKQVKKEISSEDTDSPDETGEREKKESPSTIENAIKNKVVEQIPGVKKAMQVKKTVDKAKDLLNS